MSRKWSIITPKKEGWYLIHRKWTGGSGSYCEQVKIDENGDAYYEYELPHEDGLENRYFKKQEDRFWFIGPIEFPPAPEE